MTTQINSSKVAFPTAMKISASSLCSLHSLRKTLQYSNPFQSSIVPFASYCIVKAGKVLAVVGVLDLWTESWAYSLSGGNFDIMVILICILPLILSLRISLHEQYCCCPFSTSSENFHFANYILNSTHLLSTLSSNISSKVLPPAPCPFQYYFFRSFPAQGLKFDTLLLKNR